ncbi:hypothetical protein BROUX41_000200 [Berkeleyomyces rouxiae]|uniref:uncharacterized protein n=1 Tax=Berkeleyomyces rouxiae TaxID=2035830 RepID=UPI003B80D538
MLLYEAEGLEVFTSDQDKIAGLRAGIMNRYPELKPHLNQHDNWYSFLEDLKSKSALPKYRRAPVPPQKKSTRFGSPSSERRRGCWNCNMPGHHSDHCHEPINQARIDARLAAAHGQNGGGNDRRRPGPQRQFVDLDDSDFYIGML